MIPITLPKDTIIKFKDPETEVIYTLTVTKRLPLVCIDCFFYNGNCNKKKFNVNIACSPNENLDKDYVLFKLISFEKLRQ